MPRRDWTIPELLLAMHLYCHLPFGKLHKSNPDILTLAQHLGRTPSSVAMKLTNLASLDPAQQARGIKGLSSSSKSDRNIWTAYHQDWTTHVLQAEQLISQNNIHYTFHDSPRRAGGVNPLCLSTAQDAPTHPPGATGSASALPFDQPTPTQPDESLTTTKTRLTQRFFRQAVLTAYDSTCALTGFRIPKLLIASHILPWHSHPDHRTNPRNGLCLNRLHDAAFDQGLITFDEDLRLILSPQLKHATTNTFYKTNFHSLTGSPLNTPTRFLPNNDFLTHHRQSIFLP